MGSWREFVDAHERRFPGGLMLNGPAAAADIEALESSFGHELPAALKDLFAVADGQREGGHGALFGLKLLSVSEVRSELESWASIVDGGLDGMNDWCESTPAEAIRLEYANKAWLPLFGDYGGNFIGLDFDPGPAGAIGQVINFGGDEDAKYVLAADLSAFLTLVTDLIEHAETKQASDGSVAHADLHFSDALKRLVSPD